MKNTFRSLRNADYRLWFIGAFVSNIGTWLQRTVQDWIVIAELSAKNAAAVGVVVALQFAPQLIFLPIIGWATDYFDRKKLLLITQIFKMLLAVAQAILILSGHIQLYQMYILALLLGIVSAFDTLARHTFVTDLVPDSDLQNAVSINSISFNSARMLGPALSGGLILLVGAGWVFALNALTFLPVIIILLIINPKPKASQPENADEKRPGGSIIDGFIYIKHHPDMTIALVMFFLFGLFGLNFSVYLSAMTVNVFQGNSQQFGLMISAMAIGSIVGALFTAKRESPNIRFIAYATLAYSVFTLISSAMGNYWAFTVSLFAIGVTTQLFTTSVHSLIQLASIAKLRGRIIAILLSTSVGGTAVGGPLVGWVADNFGARMSMVSAGFVGLLTASIGLIYLARRKH